ncbi:MAG: hypothetical protein HY700_04805 [Gemmatimonadetes bacterium]|nr:hypothetical protein [Gemmatimonadota bacterium]
MVVLVLVLMGGVVGFLAGYAMATGDGEWRVELRSPTPGRITRREPWEIPELLDHDRR